MQHFAEPGEPEPLSGCASDGTFATTASRRRDLLERAQAFATAALRDFQRYRGGAAKEEGEARQLLDDILEAINTNF